jgi:DNA-binding NarL/FixJ family response regulator
MYSVFIKCRDGEFLHVASYDEVAHGHTTRGNTQGRMVPRVCSAGLFLSQEFSPDIVQEALSVGVQGYILKAYAGSGLLIAVDSVIQGKQFVRIR